MIALKLIIFGWIRLQILTIENYSQQ